MNNYQISLVPSVQVKIKLFDPTLPLPQYQSSGAAGFDLYSRVNLEIPAHTTQIIPLNIALEVPNEYWILIAARSSLHKRGLHLANNVGVGDPDYCGDQDEYQLILHNSSDQSVKIIKGERLAQAIIMPRILADFEQVTSLTSPNRGGIGSTGK